MKEVKFDISQKGLKKLTIGQLAELKVEVDELLETIDNLIETCDKKLNA